MSGFRSIRRSILALLDHRGAPDRIGDTIRKFIDWRRQSCAVLRHIGTDDELEAKAKFLYSEWLPRSGEEPRDFPLYLQRVRFFPDVPEHQAVVDIFLPLK